MLWISSEQPAAEAKKADGASWTVLLIPTPPALTGSDACNQAGSDAMETFTMLLKTENMGQCGGHITSSGWRRNDGKRAERLETA